mmetsp:Transcript_85961/g.216336  ORF Transcript_85961/g.216336 Transcript_85961/m.216336 type:complete len:409 (-) Transcript_85961:345-1571(-)
MVDGALLSGLPSITALRRESDKADTFAQIKDWVKGLSKRGDLATAGKSLPLEHCHAVAHFLWKESQGGVRQGRAKELLGLIAEVPQFVAVKKDEPWSEEALNLSVTGLSFIPMDAEPPADAGLPPASELRSERADGRELFQQLRSFVRARTHAGLLAEAGAELSVAYRSCVFAFLCEFVHKKTVFRGLAKDMLRTLAGIDTWSRGGAVDREAIAKALQPAAGVEEVPGSPSGQDEGLSPSCGDESPPSREALMDPKAEEEELLRQLCAWVESGRRSGRLASDAVSLAEEHRRSITAFLCSGMASPARVAAAPPTEARPSQAAPMRRQWSIRALSNAAGKATMAGSLVAGKTEGSKKTATADPASTKGIAPEKYYVLQSLAELEGWWAGEAALDQTAVSRALAQLPRAG